MLNRAGAEAGHVHGPGCEHDHQGGTAGPADGITSPMNGTLEPPGSNPSGSSAFAMDGNFPETSGSSSDVDDPSSTTTSSSEDSDGGGSSSSEDGGGTPPLR